MRPGQLPEVTFEQECRTLFTLISVEEIAHLRHMLQVSPTDLFRLTCDVFFTHLDLFDNRQGAHEAAKQLVRNFFSRGRIEGYIPTNVILEYYVRFHTYTAYPHSDQLYVPGH